jgi:multidrug resistance protein
MSVSEKCSASIPSPTLTPATSAKDSLANIEKEASIEVNSFPLQPVYRYLTFETEDILLQCLRQDANASRGVVRPPAPNLKRFTSPAKWSYTYKLSIVWLCSIGALMATYAPGAYSAQREHLVRQFQESDTAIVAGITIYTAAFAIGPMILAPFSEIIGRKPLFVCSGVIFAASQLGMGFTTSYAGLVVSRFIAGFTSSTFSSIIGGTFSDMFNSEDRNTPMTIFSACTLAGTGLGPAISGVMTHNLPWQYSWYLQAGITGLLAIGYIVFFKETRANVLLSRKAKALNDWYDKCEAAGFSGLEEVNENGEKLRIRWKVKADEERKSISTMIKISLFRPFHLLFTESIVFWFSMWAAFAWMMLYLTFAGIPIIFHRNHNFTTESNGLIFLSVAIASALFAVLCIWQDKYGRGSGKIPLNIPEGRLYFAGIESICLPIGIFWLAWTLQPSIHWIVPVFGIGFQAMGIFSIYLAVFNYLADTYHTYASSAIAAQSFCRNMAGAAIPLFVDPMLTKMTFSGGLSFLGGLALLLTLVPWALIFYGPRIRARSKIAVQLSHND